MNPYRNNPFQIFSCIVVLGAFLLLCFSTSFLSIEQQKQLTSNNRLPVGAEDAEKSPIPLDNATEEKAETSPTTFSEEFLKEDTEHCLEPDIPLKHNKSHFERIAPASYGESVAQPPEEIFS